MSQHIDIKSNKRNEFIDITAKINDLLKELGITNGLCIVYVPHTTAGVTINEGADPSVRTDIIATLNRLVPNDPSYKHMEGNSDSHVKSSMIGVSITIPIENNALILGTWQAIYFCEFDGPRHRRVIVKFMEG